jgi:hypothetical protein
MNIPRAKKRRSVYRAGGMEIAGALSIASQMAMLCPPGFDDWVRRELTGTGQVTGREIRQLGPRR